MRTILHIESIFCKYFVCVAAGTATCLIMQAGKTFANVVARSQFQDIQKLEINGQFGKM